MKALVHFVRKCGSGESIPFFFYTQWSLNAIMKNGITSFAEIIGGGYPIKWKKPDPERQISFSPLCGAEMMNKHTCDMRLGGRALEESRSRQREAGMRNRGQIQLMYIIHLKMALWRLITTYVVTRGTYPFLAVRHECFLDSVPSLYSKLGVVIRLVTWHITVAQLGLNGHKEPYSHTDTFADWWVRGPS